MGSFGFGGLGDFEFWALEMQGAWTRMGFSDLGLRFGGFRPRAFRGFAFGVVGFWGLRCAVEGHAKSTSLKWAAVFS